MHGPSLMSGEQVGVLSLVTGTHSGAVRLRVEWLAAEPPLDAQWEDVVEVSFTPQSTDARLSAFEEFHPLRLRTVDNLRARFCANGMDDARRQDAVPGGLPPFNDRRNELVSERRRRWLAAR